jgi:hypothetical protein
LNHRIANFAWTEELGGHSKQNHISTFFSHSKQNHIAYQPYDRPGNVVHLKGKNWRTRNDWGKGHEPANVNCARAIKTKIKNNLCVSSKFL